MEEDLSFFQMVKKAKKEKFKITFLLIVLLKKITKYFQRPFY